MALVNKGKPKVCLRCQRINPPEQETCLTCGALLIDAPNVELDLEIAKKIRWEQIKKEGEL